MQLLSVIEKSIKRALTEGQTDANLEEILQSLLKKQSNIKVDQAQGLEKHISEAESRINGTSFRALKGIFVS